MRDVAEKIRVFLGPGPVAARSVLTTIMQSQTDAGLVFPDPPVGLCGRAAAAPRWWEIPAACGWEGTALYLDVNQLPLDDVGVLWDRIRPQTSGPPACGLLAPVGRPPRIVAIDCARAKKHWRWHPPLVRECFRRGDVDPGEFSAGRWLPPLPPAPVRMWLDCEATATTGPVWLDVTHPAAADWRLALVRTLGTNGIGLDTLRAEVEAGRVAAEYSEFLLPIYENEGARKRTAAAQRKSRLKPYTPKKAS